MNINSANRNLLESLTFSWLYVNKTSTFPIFITNNPIFLNPIILSRFCFEWSRHKALGVEAKGVEDLGLDAWGLASFFKVLRICQGLSASLSPWSSPVHKRRLEMCSGQVWLHLEPSLADLDPFSPLPLVLPTSKASFLLLLRGKIDGAVIAVFIRTWEHNPQGSRQLHICPVVCITRQGSSRWLSL